MTIEHEGVHVTATNFNPSLDELKAYGDFVNARVDNVTSIKVTLCDNDEVDIQWTAHNQRFERIRRITGYLTGDLNRWNNSKQAEEHDRVKHNPKL